MGATLMDQSTNLSLTSTCDICSQVIDENGYEYVCHQMHDICLHCASDVMKDIAMMKEELRSMRMKIPSSIQTLIAEFASSTYYNRE